MFRILSECRAGMETVGFASVIQTGRGVVTVTCRCEGAIIGMLEFSLGARPLAREITLYIGRTNRATNVPAWVALQLGIQNK